MDCPVCGEYGFTYASKPMGGIKFRYRQCTSCDHRFKTYEEIDPNPLLRSYQKLDVVPLKDPADIRCRDCTGETRHQKRRAVADKVAHSFQCKSCARKFVVETDLTDPIGKARETAAKAAKDRAKEHMSMLWDEATDLLARDAQDVAAIYIMAQRTVAIDPEGYMESAWRMVHAASGEAELVSLYEVWCKLEATVEASDTGDTTLTAMCDVGRGIEDRIVAIPATTARGLAIKVDVGRHHDKGSVMEQSLAADLAALTDNPVHPE